jgi:hypothetical protein
MNNNDHLLAAADAFCPDFPTLVVGNIVWVDRDVLQRNNADHDAFLNRKITFFVRFKFYLINSESNFNCN